MVLLNTCIRYSFISSFVASTGGLGVSALLRRSASKKLPETDGIETLLARYKKLTDALARVELVSQLKSRIKI